jgi:serpin B
VSLPKFRIEKQIRLNEVLQKLGLVDIFAGGKADLSGMDGTKELYVYHVVHKAYVDVNEEGTEAAAATGVMISLLCAPPPPEEFKADHPFLFIIRENRVKATLFMGRLYRPSDD